MNWKKWLGIIIIVLIVIGGGYLLISDGEEETATSVRTGNVSVGDVTEIVSTSGTIEAANSQEVYGQGPVSEVPVEVGSEVSQGDTLVSYSNGQSMQADLNGTVTTVNVEQQSVDNNMQMGQPSIVVEDLSNLQVSLGLSKSDASQVEVDQPVQLTYNNQTYSGTVSEIDPVATMEESTQSGAPTGGTSRSVNAVVTFNEQPENIIPGFDIDMDIAVNSAEDTLTLPIEALSFDENGNPLSYVVENGTARSQEIQTGVQSSTVIEVTEGLSEGDEVILSPSDSIEDGTAVEPESSNESQE